MAEDPVIQGLVKLIYESKMQKFWLKDELLYTKRNRLYVPNWGNLRKELLEEYHNTK